MAVEGVSLLDKGVVDEWTVPVDVERDVIERDVGDEIGDEVGGLEVGEVVDIVGTSDDVVDVEEAVTPIVVPTFGEP